MSYRTYRRTYRYDLGRDARVGDGGWTSEGMDFAGDFNPSREAVKVVFPVLLVTVLLIGTLGGRK